MNNYILLFSFLLLICIEGKSQHANYQVSYTGKSTAIIDGSGNLVEVTLPRNTTLDICNITIYNPKTSNTNATNSQGIPSLTLATTSSNFNNPIVLSDNIYGNDSTLFTLASNVSSSFEVFQICNVQNTVDLSSGFVSNDQFPSVLWSEYTQPTSTIQSDDYLIRTLAEDETDGCTKMQDAVEKIAQWVVGNITYKATTNYNIDEDAVSVLNRKQGNCCGYTNLMIALLRSVNIPARFVGGSILNYGYYIPFTPGYRIKVGEIPTGNGEHAVCEVFYPNQSKWCLSDPQATLNFVTTNFIRRVNGPVTYRYNTAIAWHATKGTPTFKYVTPGTVTSFQNNYAYDSYKSFIAPNSASLLSPKPPVYVGLNDKVTIVDGTRYFKAGEWASYTAEFYSPPNSNGDPTNHVVQWDWSIRLYHTGGTYTLKSWSTTQATQWDWISTWNVHTDRLPFGYDWIYDENNRIFGEVVIYVTLSDGDHKTDVFQIGVDECAQLDLSNLTYTTNFSEKACYITLDNINIQNNAKVKLDYSDGVIFNGNLNIDKGSQLIVNGHTP
jgi:hypothetical protein